MSTSGASSFVVRVAIPAVWDTLALEVDAASPLRELKRIAHERIFAEKGSPDDFLLKLNGLEVRDESLTVGEAGGVAGSTFLMSFRRRRPVR